MKWIFVLIFSIDAFGICHPQNAEQLASLNITELKENSGIDFSRTHKDIFWSHTDSGNSNALFAINLKGELQARIEVKNAQNIDWEDIAVAKCFYDQSKECIYIADVGNNKRNRKIFDVYVIPEPQVLSKSEISATHKLSFPYPGEYNFEAFAVNEKNNKFYLISKADKNATIKNHAIIFSFSATSNKLENMAEIYFEKFPGSFRKEDMIVTSADFDSKSETLLIGTKGQAYEIKISELTNLYTATNIIEIPQMEQSEAIAYYDDSIITTTEGIPQPLYRLSCGL